MIDHGSYLISRDGELFKVDLHAPSTTYVDRGIERLSCTDAQFLLDIGKFTESDAECVLNYCIYSYFDSADMNLSMYDAMKFAKYEELRYAPDLNAMLLSYVGTTKNFSSPKSQAEYERLNSRWYLWLKNNFVKVSIWKNSVEFRISSEDGFNWTDVIIDDFILNYEEVANMKFTIVRESSKGYQAYLIDATLDEVLESDNVIMSSEFLHRDTSRNDVVYL